MTLPDIPHEAIDALAEYEYEADTGRTVLSATAKGAATLLWPHLYAAAIRHAAQECVDDGHGTPGTPLRVGLPYPLRQVCANWLDRLADEAVQ